MIKTVHRPTENPCLPQSARRKNAQRFFRSVKDARWWIATFVGIFSIILGVVGFQKYFVIHNESKSLATAIYNALWAFNIEPGNLISPIPWQLEVARWLSPAVAMYAVVLGFAALFRDQVHILSLGFLRSHVVICGLGQKGLNIARNFRETGFPVVIIELDGNNPNIAACRELGAIVLVGDSRDEYLLERAGVKRARYLIGVCGEDGVNSDVAVIARNLVASRKSGKLNCTIHIKDPNLWVLLRAQEFSAEENPTFRLDIFNIYDQGAKQLFRDFPLPPMVAKDKKAPHLLIIGFGPFSEQLILNASRKWALIFEDSNTKLLISVIDPQAEAYVDHMRQKYSLVDKLCEWKLLSYGTESPEFIKAQFLPNSKNDIDVSTIYVMIEDERIGLSSAFSLLERLRDTQVRILVRMNEEKGLASLIQETRRNSRLFDRLFLFGLMERTCKLDLLYNSSHEAISRAIHEEYLHQEELKGNLPGSSPILVPWDCLPEEYKEMNRTQADSIGTKLRAIHCDILPWTDYGGDKFSFEPGEIELLSALEHERWCAQKRLQGWQYGANRDDRLKIHPSLLPYGDPRLSEEEKEKDRNTIRQIPLYLASAGYQIYRKG